MDGQLAENTPPGFTPENDTSPAGRLVRYIQQKRKYCFFVGLFKSDHRRWVGVSPIDSSTLVGQDGTLYEVQGVRSFIVTYSNGEVLDSELMFAPIPDGVHWIDEAENPTIHYLKSKDFKDGGRFVEIHFGAHPRRSADGIRYATWLTNISTRKIRVTRFGAYSRHLLRYRLDTVSKTFFTAEHFRHWYGLEHKEWIEPGETVSDPNNYGGSGVLWAFWCETDEGEKFIVAKRDR